MLNLELDRRKGENGTFSIRILTAERVRSVVGGEKTGGGGDRVSSKEICVCLCVNSLQQFPSLLPLI